jgi:SAM-dependent methyltransferase
VTSAAWQRWRERIDLDAYDERWARMAASGEQVHGEADLVAALQPRHVLDAGCGTGRVAIELARRGIDVVGVDADADMLERARRKAPGLAWVLADLAALDLDRRFDVVVLAGNVLPFVEPADRAAAVQACARHVTSEGRLVIGAGLQAGWPGVDELDGWAAAAGLELVERFAGWGREPWSRTNDYAVSIIRPARAATTARAPSRPAARRRPRRARGCGTG